MSSYISADSTDGKPRLSITHVSVNDGVSVATGSNAVLVSSPSKNCSASPNFVSNTLLINNVSTTAVQVPTLNNQFYFGGGRFSMLITLYNTVTGVNYIAYWDFAVCFNQASGHSEIQTISNSPDMTFTAVSAQNVTLALNGAPCTLVFDSSSFTPYGTLTVATTGPPSAASNLKLTYNVIGTNSTN
jgi:hypothetical protein